MHDEDLIGDLLAAGELEIGFAHDADGRIAVGADEHGAVAGDGSTLMRQSVSISQVETTSPAESVAPAGMGTIASAHATEVTAPEA